VASDFFDPDSNQWLEYDVYDLQGISASFRQYLDGADPSDVLLPLVTAKVNSIDAFLADHPVAGWAQPAAPIPVRWQRWRLGHDAFRAIREVQAEDSAAVVWYGVDHSGREVAIKRLSAQELDRKQLVSYQREINVLATVSDPTLIGFVGATDSPPYCIVLEWVGGGTLFEELHQRRRLSPTQLSIAAFDIAWGMHILHSKSIIHRSLKSPNVLLDAQGKIRISDFRFAKLMTIAGDGLLTNPVGPPHWTAPEFLDGQSAYDFKVDVYSYGIILWEILTGAEPWEGLPAIQIITQVVASESRLEIPDGTPADLRGLIEECWTRDPNARPTFEEILRRFHHNQICFPGADAVAVQRHVQDRMGAGPDEALDDDGICRMLDDLAASGFPALPARIIRSSWLRIERSSGLGEATKIRAGFMFLETPLKGRAAGLLRGLPAGAASGRAVDRIRELLQTIPTGNDDFDRDIVVCACKNGLADYAVVFANAPAHLKLALEVAGQAGVRSQMVAAVADRCCQKLAIADEALVCAALRCLVGIGAVRRIPIDLVVRYVGSDSAPLRNCAMMVGTKMCMLGKEMTEEVFERVVQRTADSMAQPFLIEMCRSPHIAVRWMREIARGTEIDARLALRVMLAAARHEEARPAIRGAIAGFDFTAIADELIGQIEILRRAISE
jgi:tRNA A-37 threonylcarbamoyl transferase component Bud32